MIMSKHDITSAKHVEISCYLQQHACCSVTTWRRIRKELCDGRIWCFLYACFSISSMYNTYIQAV
jgi:hypothetical protein